MRLLSLITIFILLAGLYHAHAQNKDQRAFQLTCGETIIIVEPPTAPTLTLARKLAEFLETQVCTVEVIKLKRP